jgi:hypothetical protein
VAAWPRPSSLSGYRHLPQVIPKVAVVAAFGLLLSFFSGCTERQAELQSTITTFLDDWYTQAQAGNRDDNLCHGMGLLKHPELSCKQMLASAATIDTSSQHIEAIKPIECFSGVCGDMFEITITAKDRAGNEINESHILKRDAGKLRVYWYRNDALMAQLRMQNPVIEEQKDPEQVAYDELIARYPALYEYPPCYGIRASSSNLAGPLMPIDDIDVANIQSLASGCDNFCFALVGNKIAPLCPQ